MTSFTEMVSGVLGTHRAAMIAQLRGMESPFNAWNRAMRLARWTRASEFRRRQREWVWINGRDGAWFCAQLWEAAEQ